MRDVMVDLETLGTASDSAIISIGAVEFDRQGALGREFYMIVDADSCQEIGLKINAATVLWWMRQTAEARRAFEIVGEPIQHALLEFGNWLPCDAMVWGNGASFDNSILATAYQKAKIEQPWKFWNDRCFRTLKSMTDVDVIRQGTYHNALDDAKYQAQCANAIFAKLKGAQ